MKKHCYTIIEMLTVIAVIAILAAIVIPTVANARARARLSNCTSNQGQTMKIVLAAMMDKNNKLYSGDTIANPTENGTVTSGASWINYLVEKNYVQSLDAFRCTGFVNTTDPKYLNQNTLKESFGMVVASNGIFDFRGSKLRMYNDGSKKRELAANSIVLGGCSVKDNKAYALLNSLSSDSSYGKVAQVHRRNANLFFLDGHSEIVDQNNYKANKFVPKADGTEAVAFTADWEVVE